jgi:hypothetical protein
MKIQKSKIFKFAMALLVASSLGSCKKLTEDLYTDPNSPLDAPAEFILPGASIANGLLQEGEVARLTGMWSGYFTGGDRQYLSLEIYQSTAPDYDSPWQTLYTGAFAQADLVLQKAVKLGNPRLAAIAKIHKAMAAGTAAALWGDVPYTEANQFEQIRTPKYDPQRDVYAAAIALLDDAIKDIDSGKGGLVDKSKDIFFGGNFTAWKKVAISLKARYYLHLKEYVKANDNAKLGISNSAEELIIPHGEELGNINIYNYFLDNERPGYLMGGAYIFDLMKKRQNAKTDETDRIAYYFLDDTGEEPNYGDGIFALDADYLILGAAETSLILAETSLRKSSPSFSEALAALNTHREAMGFDTYTAADFNTGGLENKDGINANDALLREILEEKYVSLYGSIEGYNDLRRTWKDAVRVKVPVKGTTATSIPLRLLYPQSEVNTNPNIPNPLPGLFEATPVNK